MAKSQNANKMDIEVSAKQIGWSIGIIILLTGDEKFRNRENVEFVKG